MVIEVFHKAAFSAFAAVVAAGAGLVNSASVENPAAYGAAATRLEADAAAKHAGRTFDRADLNNDGALDFDEFALLAVVTAELAQLNGFISVDLDGAARTVAIARTGADLNESAKQSVKERAAREFAYVSGDDERLGKDEFIGAQLERFLASDADRNAVLAGSELRAFAQRQSQLQAAAS